MPDYLNQTKRQSRSKRIEEAIDYFLQLKEQKYPDEKARQKVYQETGVIL